MAGMAWVLPYDIPDAGAFRCEGAFIYCAYELFGISFSLLNALRMLKHNGGVSLDRVPSVVARRCSISFGRTAITSVSRVKKKVFYLRF